jgi:uncharacterized protein (TIGR02265 family)
VSYIESAIDLVAPHCDIVDRLRVIPLTARVRGLLFHSIESELDRRGKRGRFRDLFPDDRFSSMPYYPLADYLVRLAAAGAVVTSPADVHEGMKLVSHGNAAAFAESLLGRVLIRILAHDPVRLTEQGLAAQRQMSSYSHWTLVRHDARKIEVLFRDEYVWIESALLGSGYGTFESCGVEANITCVLQDRFNGSHLISW